MFQLITEGVYFTRGKKFFFGRLKMVQYSTLSLLSYLIYHERIPYFRRITRYEISEFFKNPP